MNARLLLFANASLVMYVNHADRNIWQSFFENYWNSTWRVAATRVTSGTRHVQCLLSRDTTYPMGTNRICSKLNGNI